jgi:putative hydrolase of the HAD superfamily
MPTLTPEALVAEIDATRTWYWDDRERHRLGRLNLDRARTEIVAMALQRHGIDAPALAAHIAICHAELRAQVMKPFPGALETLNRFRERGMRLALLTNGAGIPQRGKIERFGLASFFDCIIIEGEFGVGKPDERVYCHALRQLSVAPADAWMVGDNLEWDVGAPQQLGMTGVWVDFAGMGLPASSDIRPDYTISSLTELATLLQW